MRLLNGRGGFGTTRACTYFSIGLAILRGAACGPEGPGKILGEETLGPVAVIVVVVVGGW